MTWLSPSRPALAGERVGEALHAVRLRLPPAAPAARRSALRSPRRSTCSAPHNGSRSPSSVASMTSSRPEAHQAAVVEAHRDDFGDAIALGRRRDGLRSRWMNLDDVRPAACARSRRPQRAARTRAASPSNCRDWVRRSACGSHCAGRSSSRCRRTTRCARARRARKRPAPSSGRRASRFLPAALRGGRSWQRQAQRRHRRCRRRRSGSRRAQRAASDSGRRLRPAARRATDRRSPAPASHRRPRRVSAALTSRWLRAGFAGGGFCFQ